METAILGLVGKVHQLHQEMNKLRRTFGIDLTLREHLAALPGGGVTPEQLYQELKIDPRTMTIENLLTRDDDTRWLVPEVIRDAIRSGFTDAPIWPDLVAADEPVGSASVKFPKIDYSKATPEVVAEGGTIPVGSVSYGDKDVKLVKRGVGLDVTYETIRFSTINLLAVFLADVGVRLGNLVTKTAIETLLNGEQDDGSEAAATIGVNDTEAGIKYKDFLRVWTRMNRSTGSAPDTIVSGEDLAIDVLELDEFKKRYQGNPDVALRLKRPLPSEQNVFVHSAVTSGKILNVNSKQAMAKVTAEPLMVEGDRIIARQIEKSVATTIFGFGILKRTGRALIDTTVAWDDDHDWPSWFAPIEEIA